MRGIGKQLKSHIFILYVLVELFNEDGGGEGGEGGGGGGRKI